MTSTCWTRLSFRDFGDCRLTSALSWNSVELQCTARKARQDQAPLPVARSGCYRSPAPGNIKKRKRGNCHPSRLTRTEGRRLMKRALKDFITTHVFGTHSFARHLLSTLGLSALIIAAATASAAAQQKYDPGVTDTE